MGESSTNSSMQTQNQRRPSRRRRYWSKGLPSLRCMLVVALLFFSVFAQTSSAWEWTDLLAGTADTSITFQSNTLSMEQVRELRVRDIKRRLSRHHGYSAEELGRILDKAELIQALSFEEHKEREKHNDQVKRALLIRGFLGTIVAIFVVAGWPVWTHLYAVASVNFVVYWDKKKYETSRCIELRSVNGAIGVLLMGIVDCLSIWLSMSILLSWFTSSQYFFPTPNLPIRPAAMMGGQVASGPLAKYGFNVGPMAISWAMRFAHGKLEIFTGKALSESYQRQKRAARQGETPEERVARKAARKAAKRAAKEEAEQRRKEQESSEAQRRKEAADQATQHLFGGGAGGGGTTQDGQPPAPGPETHVSNEEKEFREEVMNNMNMDHDKEFREQMDNMDMDDLD